MNKTILIGRITKEVDLRRTNNGTAVVSFTLAVENRFNKDENGKPTADFINCVAWNKTAEIMDSYVSKGQLLAVEGRIQTRNYEDKDGRKVYVTEIVVESLQMLEYVKKEESNSPSDNYSSDQDSDYIEDDDLPF